MLGGLTLVYEILNAYHVSNLWSLTKDCSLAFTKQGSAGCHVAWSLRMPANHAYFVEASHFDVLALTLVDAHVTKVVRLGARRVAERIGHDPARLRDRRGRGAVDRGLVDS